MQKMIPKLDEILKDESLINYFFGEDSDRTDVVLSAANVDDVFRFLYKEKIEQVKVNREQMFLITMYMAANITCCTKNKESISMCAWRLLSEAVTDKFIGIKLILEDDYVQ